MSEKTLSSAPRAAARAESRPDFKAFHKAAVDLLVRFHIVIKNARIYESNNDMFREQVKALFGSVDGFLAAEGEATLRVRHSALFFNGVRLRFVLGTYPIFRFILDEFRDRDIGALSFSPGLSQEELARFSAVFAKREKGDGRTFEKLVADLLDAEVANAVLEPASVRETFTTLQQNSARIFFLSILHLKETFESDQRQEKLRVNTTRRLMQSIYNHVVDNEAFMCGLTTLKNYDEYTLNHSVNVCVLALALGRRLGLSRSELVDLGMAAFLHDLGKLDTPLEILNKPTRLSEEERQIMELHPQQGAEKLLHLKEFKRLPLRAVHVALEHHIREDQAGYPRAFKRADVNLFSKIVKIVDYFDAITTKRVYRSGVLTRAEALNLMLEQSGREFNPVILKAFVNLMGVFPIGTLVLLDTSEAAIVMDANPDAKLILRPRVKLISDGEGNRIDGAVVDLSDRDPVSGNFPRSIVKALDPVKYDVEVSDYFLAQAQ